MPPPDLAVSTAFINKNGIYPISNTSSTPMDPISPADLLGLPTTLTQEFRHSLQCHPMFKDLMQSPLFFQDLLHQVSCRSVSVGDTMIKAGEPGKAMFFLMKGQMAVTTKDGETVLAVLGPGQFFGEMALILNSPRVATVTCIEKALVLVLQQAHLMNLFERYPHLKSQFQTITQQRLDILRKHQSHLDSSFVASSMVVSIEEAKLALSEESKANLSLEPTAMGLETSFTSRVHGVEATKPESMHDDDLNHLVFNGLSSISPSSSSSFLSSASASTASSPSPSPSPSLTNLTALPRKPSTKMDSVVNPSVVQVMMKDPSKRRASIAVWSDPKFSSKFKEPKPPTSAVPMPSSSLSSSSSFSFASSKLATSMDMPSGFLRVFQMEDDEHTSVAEKIIEFCTIPSCFMLSSTNVFFQTWFKEHPTWVRVMDLSGCKSVDDDVLKLIARDWAAHIESLNLSNCFAITDAGVLPLLAACRQLRSLNLKNCWNVLFSTTPSTPICIPSLVSLNLDNVRKLTNLSLLSCFQWFPELQKLSISYCKLIDTFQDPSPSSFTSSTSSWARLHELNLHRCTNLTQETFFNYFQLDTNVTLEWQLRKLNLADHSTLVDATLLLLASHVPWLHALNLSFCSSLTSQCVAALQVWELTILDVSYCHALINDQVLESLVLHSFQQLQKLGLRGCSQLTDLGVQALFTLTQLTTVNVSQCPKLSSSVLEKAKQKWRCLTTESVFEIN